VRLRSAYFVTCQSVIKDEAGKVVELRCAYDPSTRGGAAPDGRKPKATLHWLSAAHALPAEVRLYDHLFRSADPGAADELMDDLSPASEIVLGGAFVEASLAEVPIGTTVQFERLGYFCADPDSSTGRLVFNRTLTLKDTWAKIQAGGPAAGAANG
jgi:glutaminyl-tRNA synthetase